MVSFLARFRPYSDAEKTERLGDRELALKQQVLRAAHHSSAVGRFSIRLAPRAWRATTLTISERPSASRKSVQNATKFPS
jgi:hypothetical protein